VTIRQLTDKPIIVAAIIIAIGLIARGVYADTPAKMHNGCKAITCWVNEKNGNIYGNSTFNPEANPILNSKASPTFNPKQNPAINSQANPTFNYKANPLISVSD
jgi:hypothetical protein